MPKIKRTLLIVCWILAVGILIYTRFVGLDWGLPYHMHPDERNMANAIQQFDCKIPIFSRFNRDPNDPKFSSGKFQIKECLNPNFFAYGQFPLYLGYGIVFILKFFDGDLTAPVSFEEAAISLRIISALASIVNILVLLKIVGLISERYSILDIRYDQKDKKIQISKIYYLISLLILIFSPFFIQFSHFGTTESLLMLLYSIIIYLCIKFAQNKISVSRFQILVAFFSGIAVATKVSSLLFLIVPAALVIDKTRNNFLARVISIWYVTVLALVFSILFSPHNFINFSDFLGSMKYESDVAVGAYKAFYTRQFEMVDPIIFQINKIFPYVMGWPAFIFFIFGFLFLPFKPEFNLLRLAIIVGFLPNAFFYAKWTRFVAPILPLMLLIGVLFLVSVYRFFLRKISNIKYQRSKLHFKYQKFYIYTCHFAFCILIFALIIPGIAYLSVYQKPDVRFTASEWIYKNIPSKSYILSETANVVDVPIPSPKYRNDAVLEQFSNLKYISFNFYDLDVNPELQPQLPENLAKADYIFIPSRRIFANHYCPRDEILPIASRELNFKLMSIEDEDRCSYLRKAYPLLNNYYDKLFSGELGFNKVAEFNSFPKIQLFGKTLLEFTDEEAEETWTVFDHPVLRIYKKL